MKITKILSAAAATVVAASALAASASATLTLAPSPDAGLSTGTGSWLVQLYNVGNEAEGKPATDYGVDLTKVSRIEVTFKAAEPDWWDGQTGGSIIYSVNGGDITADSDYWGTYNWPSLGFWGVVDEDLELATQDPAQTVVSEKVGDYTYKIGYDVVNPLAVEAGIDEIGCMQIGMQEWGSSMSEITVVKCDVLDASGNLMISFDENGVASAASAGTSAPSTDAGTSAPSKGSPDTGVEGVAAVAGLAVVAAGAVVLSKKRK